jgi:hypothetical protein
MESRAKDKLAAQEMRSRRGFLGGGTEPLPAGKGIGLCCPWLRAMVLGSFRIDIIYQKDGYVRFMGFVQ